MNGATIINAETLHKKIKLATSRRGNHITKHVTELMNLLLNKLNNHLCYALLLSSAIIILSVTSLPLDSEQSNLEYQSKAKRDTMINRTKLKIQSAINILWTKIETTIVNLPTRRKPRHFGMLGHKSPRYSPRPIQFMAIVAIAMSASNVIENRTNECNPFDTDSGPVGIDNRCSGCITHIRSDIPGEIRECNRAIKGFGGTRVSNVWMGTIQWSWDDDDGQTHKMVIQNSYYVPDGKVRLLSPQHWAQQRDKCDRRGGAGETTTGTHTKLFSADRKFTRTVPILRDDNNVATFPPGKWI